MVTPVASSIAFNQRVQESLRREIGYIGNPLFSQKRGPYAKGVPEVVLRIELDAAEELDASATRGLPAHLSRMCSTPLLSADDERVLFQRMNYCKFAANRLRAALKQQSATEAQLDEIADLLRRAERIRNYLVRANTRLVMSIARKFADFRNPFDDLLSQGIASLMHAVEKFDYDRGYRFSTYATCAVRRDLYRLVMAARRDGQRFSTGANEHLAETTDEREQAPAQVEASWKRLSRALDSMLEKLDTRERMIVKARFGLDDSGKKASYSRLGDRLGISKERVRQLANRALDKLREQAPEHRLEALLG